MKKLFISFVAIFALSVYCFAETGVLTSTLETSTLTTWEDGSTHATLQVGQVQFVCTNGEGQTNGKWIKASSQWRVYYTYSYGPMMVQAKSGYMVKDVTLTYGSSRGGILTDVASADQQEANPAYASGTKISIEGTKQFYVGRSTDVTSGVFLYFTKFVVTYYKLPTAIAIDSALSLSIGQSSALAVTATPANAYAGCSWVSSDTTIAKVDQAGKVTAVATGKATITATSVDGAQSATCEVSVAGSEPSASFATKVVAKSIGEAAFTNALNTESTGAVTYSSSDTTVATVDANGEVTIINGGTAQIKASIAPADPFGPKELFYTLDVSHNPEEGTYWIEDFANVTKDKSIVTDTVEGKDAVYTWSLCNYQRNNTDSVGNVQGMRLRYPSVWQMIDNPEGGIKEVAFDWRASGKNNVVHFFVAAGEEEYEYSRVPIGSNTKINSFARQFSVTDNVALKFRMSGAEESPAQTYAIIGQVKIVPYLLYTTKQAQVDVNEGTYSNTSILNNTDKGTVTYAIEDAESQAAIATIDDPTTGVVSLHGAGTVKVIATWSEGVSTSYQLEITGMPTNIESIYNTESQIRKMLINDHIYIMRGDCQYDLQGNKK